MSVFPAAVSTLPELIRWHADRTPDKVVLCDGDRTTTWRELDLRSSTIAQALLRAGVQRGERVALLDHDRDSGVALIFGIARAGAVVLGLNWRLTAPELQFQLEDASVRTLFVGTAFVELARGLQAVMPTLQRVVAIGSGAPWPDLATFVAGAPAVDPALPIGREDLAVQMYTSGTTGRPKGVMLAHRSFFAIVGALRDAGDPWIGWNAHDVTLCGMPLFHIGGFWWTMQTLNAGACLCLLDRR